MQIWETATHYHLIHALAMVLAGVVYELNPKKPTLASGVLFGVGTVIFSGSLYALAVMQVVLHFGWLPR